MPSRPFAGVELHGGHVGEHRASRGRSSARVTSTAKRRPRLAVVEVEVVVVAVAEGELLVLVGQCAKPSPMRFGSRRSKGVPPTGRMLAGGDAVLVGNDGEGVGS